MHMRHDRKLLVVARWDDEAEVWVATSDDVPGLVTEDASLDRLVRRIRDVIPELLDDNAHHLDEDRERPELDFHVISSIPDRDGAPAR